MVASSSYTPLMGVVSLYEVADVQDFQRFTIHELPDSVGHDHAYSQRFFRDIRLAFSLILLFPKH